MAQAMGGAERVERQHAGGRMTVYERIEHILDPGYVSRIGALAGAARYDAEGNIAGFTPANCVFGQSKVNGSSVVIAGDDFTVRGGSADTAEAFLVEEVIDPRAFASAAAPLRTPEGSRFAIRP